MSIGILRGTNFNEVQIHTKFNRDDCGKLECYTLSNAAQYHKVIPYRQVDINDGGEKRKADEWIRHTHDMFKMIIQIHFANKIDSCRG